MEDDSARSQRSIGHLLQEARAAKGLTIEGAADASKISIAFVRLMEQDQFALLPDPIYIIRFLREYAAFLGLDPLLVEAQFSREVRAARVRSSPRVAGFTREMKLPIRHLLLGALLIAVLIPPIFIGLSLLSGRPPERQLGQEVSSSEPPQTAAPVPQIALVAPPEPGVAAVNAGQPSEPSQARPAAPPRYTLRAEAKEETWLAISADGVPHREVLLHEGETMEWWAEKGFVVTIGNAGGVELSLNSRPVLLKGGRGRVIRDMTLPDDDEPMATR